ncbi:hypothetical protein CH63R_12780 [Colletotrichum higginsianum IMI 349063]|uniref:Uncharacterized protein n=3 Tax=Colletotrichum higginsianum TaxID=80884 RepID=A0A1B7XV81_COLHI|nr:hypothetical protein CH63R_12780 [Colletotrichum higginsianum IMI 349063]OBR03653.1 hypothetical protein CH63R_12780 [Colletotrichum higginsianum IMI 349063]TIC97805.1 hypothetical protein CH35J_006772 [Colletotrichum higginsianum]
MASTSFSGNGYVMGSRIPIRDVNPINTEPTSASPVRIASRIIGARAECTGSASQCEKPVDPSSLTLPITLGITIPIVGALFLLFYFHRRNVKRQALEDATDPNRGLDFGMGETSPDKGGKKRKSLMFREKGGTGVDTKHRQLSMDMNLSSPYLLPPGLQSSRESLHSLARTLHNEADPYRPVAQYANSDAGSVYTKTTSRRGSAMTGRTNMTQSSTLPPRQNSLPRQDSLPRPPPATADPFATPKSRSGSPVLAPISPGIVSPTSPVIRSPLVAEPIIPQIETVPYPDDKNGSSHVQIPDIPEPAPVARRGLPSNPRPSPGHPTIPEAREPDSTPAGQADAPVGLGLDDLSFPAPSHRLSPPAGGALPASPRPQKEAAPSTLPAIVPEETNAYDNYDQHQDYHDFDFEDRGRSQRRSVDLNDNRQSRALGVPAQDSKRLSVGFRPLPPDEVMESEDPEERANRIRSFYKEYFDPDNPHANQQPPPPMPRGPPRGHPQGGPQYYEDYDPGYAGGPPAGDAYFDPETNSFVMPYAQPVTRRAMTPPPNGSRFRGPPPPRVLHGSMGGGRMASPGPGGRRPPPPRVGSAMSSRLGPSRPGSDMSSQYTPRPGSSVSNRTNGGRPRPKGPPPADLTTLPNPSKLKDDSFSILNPLDFAPPETFSARARGRSQSPAGERRPYAAPQIPVHSPLVSSFEEMPAMPSPHLLRKSGTFTALDFAPPRKFKDSDTMSDAGSIRSNRSGISAVQNAALRSGAGRVSRLPGDTVFTTNALQDQLKPQWGMRP